MRMNTAHSGKRQCGTWRHVVCCVLLLLVLFGFAPAVSAEPSRNGSTPLRVVMDDNYPPYIFKDTDGSLHGILVDRWRLWEKKTGIRVELSAMAWGDAQRRMQAGEFDVIDTIFRNEAREKIYEFSKPYARIDVPLFFRSDISGIQDVRDLKGFVVAAKEGDSVLDVLRSHGITTILEFKSYEAIVAAARDRKVNVFTVDRPPALYFLYRFGIHDQFRETAPLYSGEFHRAVRKGETSLLDRVESGFAMISEGEYRDIDIRWLGAPIFSRDTLRYVKVAAAVTGVLVGLLLLWLWSLKRSVARKTLALRDEVRARIAQEDKLRESEEKYRMLIETTGTGYVILDVDGRVLDANLEYMRLSGQSALSGILGRKVSEWTAAHDLEKSADAVRQCAEKGVVRNLKLDYVTPRGKCLPVEINAAALNTSDGVRLIALCRDITERESRYEQVLKAQKMESLGLLAGGIAHDFNNILAGIMGNISLAEMLVADPQKVAAPLAAAAKASKRAAELAHQLLTFARGGQPIKKELSIGRLLEETVSFMLRGANVRATMDIPETLHAVEADGGQLSQTFNNIILNALQAMPGGGNLTVSAENIRLGWEGGIPLPSGAYVRIRFADEGSGIPAENLKNIFDPYFTTKADGTGLGLASVHSIIRQHGGHIEVRSEVGKGTVFDFYLPSTGEPCVEEPGRPETSRHTAPGAAAILVMDDEEVIREMLEAVLMHLGYRVATCEGGREAIDLYKAAMERGAPFSAVIMDLTIPGGMGGKEACRRILELDPHAKLIVSSGYSNDPIMADFRAHGFSGMVAKPFSASELVRVLGPLLTSDA